MWQNRHTVSPKSLLQFYIESLYKKGQEFSYMRIRNSDITMTKPFSLKKKLKKRKLICIFNTSSVKRFKRFSTTLDTADAKVQSLVNNLIITNF